MPYNNTLLGRCRMVANDPLRGEAGLASPIRPRSMEAQLSTRAVPKTFDAAEVIARLEQLFPDRAPSPDATDRQVWMAVGAVEVVRWLRSELLESGESETVFPPAFETGPEITRGRDW